MIDPKLDLHPEDEHNLVLAANVHPSGWKNPAPVDRYNMVVLGAGTAGLVAAAGAAGLGARVALIERRLMGGDCLNVGCVPSKAIIRSAHAAHTVRSAGEFGIHVARDPEIDFARVMERMRRIRAGISPHDSVQRFTDHFGIDVYLGEARFTGPDTVAVEGSTLRFARAVIATGARPTVPPIPGLEEAGFLTSHDIFNLTEQPRKLAVIGGGPIGCELAQAFARLSSKVTIVEAANRFLQREDPDAADILKSSMERDGVTVRLSTTVERVELRGSEKVLVVKTPAGEETIAADQILVGVGRTPNTECLDLEKAGVEFNRTGVTIDDHLREPPIGGYSLRATSVSPPSSHTPPMRHREPSSRTPSSRGRRSASAGS